MASSEQRVPLLSRRRQQGGAGPRLSTRHHHDALVRLGLRDVRLLVTGLVHGLHVIGERGLLGGGVVTLAALVRLLTGVDSFVIV